MSTILEPEVIDAVRASLRSQVLAAAATRGATPREACTRCGDRIISLELPMSFALVEGARVCCACRGQIELESHDIYVDLGGGD